MKKICLSLILIALLLAGCTAKYMPIPSKTVKLSEQFGLINNPEYHFAAENRYWSKEPSSFTSYFTAFYVVIKNKNDDNMQIDVNDFALLDQGGNQYDPIPNEYLEKLIEPSQMELLESSIVGGSHFLDPENQLSEQKTNYEKWQQARENLIKYSFRFGDLRSGARKSGYVFFPRLPESNKQCKLVYRNSEISFTRERETKK